jgi:hypothetical protein
MVRKFISIALASLLLASFAACGGGTTPPADNTTPPATDQTTPPADETTPPADGAGATGGEATEQAPPDITDADINDLPAE